MVLAVIPARGGSKGIPRKNVRLMHGKPLIYYSIQNASNGHWYLLWKNEEQDLKSTLDIIPLNISLGELGTFTLIYRVDGQQDITLDVTIKPM